MADKLVRSKYPLLFGRHSPNCTHFTTLASRGASGVVGAALAVGMSAPQPAQFARKFRCGQGGEEGVAQGMEAASDLLSLVARRDPTR